MSRVTSSRTEVPMADDIATLRELWAGHPLLERLEEVTAEWDACRAAIDRAVVQAKKDTARIEALEAAGRKMARAYVSLIESARDRITDLGGTCDPVDVMEAADPSLNEFKSVLAAR